MPSRFTQYGGAAGADAALQQMIQQRMQQEALARTIQQQQFDNSLKTRTLDQNDELKRLALSQAADAKSGAELDKQIALTPKGADITGSGFAQQLDKQGLGFLKTRTLPQPGSTQMTGMATAAPSLQTGSGAGRIVSAQVNPAQAAKDVFAGTQADANKEADLASRESTLRQNAAIADLKNTTTKDIAQARLEAAHAATVAAAGRANDKLTRVDHKDPVTGRTVIEWLPQSQLAGQTFQKGSGSTVENRLASAEAVTQTGNDIIAKLNDPAYAKQVGPALGRYNTLRDFIGNPPPELSDLAGMIESYSLANMGVHGMRSTLGAEQIKKLLDARHTPESLAATIRGLNQFSLHYMENEERAGAKPSSAAPAAEYDYIPGQGVVPRKAQ